jgi:intein/homing endonuclease
VTRPDNWGQSIGALKSNRLRAGKIRTPAKGAELAEFIGIFLGDGNLYVDTTKGMYVVRVFLNSLTETNYAKYIKALIKRLFGIDTRIVQMKEVNCIYVNAQNKALTEFLIEQGMRSGDKIRNGITIPDWVWRNPDALRACVRGLIDTDGSVYRLVPHWPNLIQISFKNNNFRLLQDARKALLRLDFKVSAVSGNRIYITQQAEVKRYFKEVGSSK